MVERLEERKSSSFGVLGRERKRRERLKKEEGKPEEKEQEEESNHKRQREGD